ncbi:MAG: archaea-specific SMC-related protein [Haloarculaceae archaeon]
MTIVEGTGKRVNVRVQKVGGIDDTSVSFSPGVTILTGRNATNRTSFLQGLMAGLGSDNVSIKGDAESASVELTVGDETYTRTLTRTNGAVRADGDAYLEDDELADLFVFLLEANEARRAVELANDLREVIMRPVDTDAIEADIEELRAERDDVERQLDNLRTMQAQLPQLEQRRQEIEATIAEKEAELEEAKRAIEDKDRELSATRDRDGDVGDALERFRDAGSELEDVRYNLETERESVAALEEEVESLEADLEELPEIPVEDVDDVESEIDELRSEREALDETVGDLQTIVQFNEKMLDGTSAEIAAALRDDSRDAVTDRLLDDRVVCWTCGSEVDSESIEATLERLRDLRQEKLRDRRSLQSTLDELKTERATQEERKRQRSQVQTRLERARDELERRRERIEELTDERERLQDRLEALESEIENRQGETQSELLDLHREANEIEFELGQLEDDLESVTAEIERVDSALDGRDDLKARRAGIDDEIERLRTRIERTEREAVEQFNDHMETVLDILDYANLDRIWIERKERRTAEGSPEEQRSVFDLHVVRRTDDGTTYEDTVDHLSESEREVTGLVFALAGYLTHGVYETCPFLLLDSIEAIDSDRIARLVDYVAEYAEYVVVALLAEDAQALDDDYRRVTEI